MGHILLTLSTGCLKNHFVFCFAGVCSLSPMTHASTRHKRRTNTAEILKSLPKVINVRVYFLTNYTALIESAIDKS